MRALATRLSRVEMQLGTCVIHGAPLLCCRCAEIKALSPGEASELSALFLRISAAFTPGPPQPPCPRCRGMRLCPRCNGVSCLTATEQTRCTELMGKLTARRQG
jgi:hypothetical protein